MQIAVVTLTSGVDLSQNKGVGSGSVSSSVELFQAPRKLALLSIFDSSLSSFMMWNLQSYPTINERMWHLRGSEHILYTFSGGQNTQPHDLRPWSPPYGWPPSLQQPEIEFITVVIGYCTSVLLSAVPYFATSHVVVLQPLYNLTARCHLSYYMSGHTPSCSTVGWGTQRFSTTAAL